MTTLIIDCGRAKVYVDTCRTKIKSKPRKRTISGAFLEADEYRNFSISREEGTKIHKIGDGCVIVGAGDSFIIDEFSLLYPDISTIEIPQDAVNTQIFVVTKRKSCVVIDEYSPKVLKKNFFFRDEIVWEYESYMRTDGYITCGSGSKYAMGALEAGLSPEKTIEVVSRLDVYTNDNVDCVRVG